MQEARGGEHRGLWLQMIDVAEERVAEKAEKPEN